MINRFRKLLIQIGKFLPFLICAFVFLNYAETAFALATGDFLAWGGMVIPNTPFSFLVGLYFEYTIQEIVVMAIISIAIETCFYNKMACCYLLVNLIEKSFLTFEIAEPYIYGICIINMWVVGYIILKGIKNSINF